MKERYWQIRRMPPTIQSPDFYCRHVLAPRIHEMPTDKSINPRDQKPHTAFLSAARTCFFSSVPDEGRSFLGVSLIRPNVFTQPRCGALVSPVHVGLHSLCTSQDT